MNAAWEKIHGFMTAGEYARFVKYIEGQVSLGCATEIEPQEDYGRGMIYGRRWFRDVESGEIWRLIPPEPPFRGLWEPVVR